jgi:DNA-binding SARP family transcriptional activator
MEFRVLGPLEVVDDGGRPIPLGGARQRALLAALLLHANETVARDRLMDELWGDQPPASGAKALQVAVSQLRKSLGDGILQTRPGGYVLEVGPDQLDANRFERLREEARASLAAGNAERAAETLRRALGIWRGPALADVAYESFARIEAERLEELRLAALEERIAADLARGRDAELVPELEALARSHPFRERLKEQLMLALYRSGRQAEALEVYRHARRLLADELGIEPSLALQELERRILRHEPELEPPARAPILLSRDVSTRGRLLVVGGLLAAAATAVGVALLTQDGSGPVVVSPNSVAVIDPATNRIVAAVPVGESPGPIVAGLGSVWVLNRNDFTVSRIDPAKRQVVGVVAGGVEVTGGIEAESAALLAAGENALWTGNGGLLRRNERGRASRASPIVFPAGDLWTGIATGLGHVWVPSWEPSLLRIDPDRGTIAANVPLEPADIKTGWSSVAVGLRLVWVAFAEVEPGGTSRVFRYDPVSGTVAILRVEGRPSAIAVGAGAVWVTDSSGARLLRIRPRPLAVMNTITVGDEPVGVAVGEGAIWTANASTGTVSRVDAVTNEVVTIHVGHRPQGIVVANGLVWVSVRSA